MPEKVILTEQDISRTLARIAHEIVEQNRDVESLLLVGIRTRGVPLSHRLANLIADFQGPKVPIGALDISHYRDDLPSPDHKPIVQHTDIPVSVNERSIVIVDDVLYTGRSARAAMDALIDLGRPQSIQLAVLVDRGHREMPIRANYVGKNVPSSRHEAIKVQLAETDGVDEVSITDTAEGSHHSHKPNQVRSPE